MRIKRYIKYINFLPLLFFCATVFFILPFIIHASSTNVNVTLTSVGSTTPSYTITSSAGSGGSITNSITVLSGGSATFIITSNPLYEINSVTVDGVGQGATSTYTFSNVTADHTINATFDLIPVSSSGGGGGGGGSYSTILPIIKNLVVSTAENKATITWSSNNLTLSILSWGLTSDYEMGSVSDIGFTYDHTTNIENLTAGTHYYFKITGHDTSGQPISYAGDFYTLSLPNLINLPNVKDLNIAPQTNNFLISWTNPPVDNFAGVVVVRSPYAFPTDASDGQIVYDGSGNQVIDTGIKKDTTYYYSVFVYDPNKNFSSGTIGSGIILSKQTGGRGVVPPVKPPVTQPATSTEPAFVLKLSDVDFIQAGQSIITSDGVLPVVSDKNLSVSVSLSKIPAKVALATLRVYNPTGTTSNMYLFVFNTPRAAYESQVNLYGSSNGIYPFTIDLQLSNGKRADLSGEFAVIKPYTEIPIQTPFWETLYGIVLLIISGIILILLIIMLFLGLHRLLRKIKPLS